MRSRGVTVKGAIEAITRILTQCLHSAVEDLLTLATKLVLFKLCITDQNGHDMLTESGINSLK